MIYLFIHFGGLDELCNGLQSHSLLRLSLSPSLLFNLVCFKDSSWPESYELRNCVTSTRFTDLNESLRGAKKLTSCEFI